MKWVTATGRSLGGERHGWQPHSMLKEIGK